jgi:hypothetical protein
MKKPRHTVFIATLICICTLVQCQPALACSPSTDTIFSYTNHPDFPFSKYAAGNIGIPEKHYARSYLTVAYRYWSDKPLTNEEQQSALSVWNHRLSDNTDGCAMDTSEWLKARKLVPTTPKLDEISTSRMVSSDDSNSWNTYCNCQTSAFETAAVTLKNRIAKYGATSPTVASWLQAQDAVFSNCGNITYDKAPPLNIPAALPTTADTAAQQDRAYQIAAAHFYSQQFPAARAEFEAIAKDPASPWNSIPSSTLDGSRSDAIKGFEQNVDGRSSATD